MLLLVFNLNKYFFSPEFSMIENIKITRAYSRRNLSNFSSARVIQFLADLFKRLKCHFNLLIGNDFMNFIIIQYGLSNRT